MSKPVVFIVGPTGSGKSKLALMLARKLSAEIVSADSMQIYRGMDIGTAKPTRKEQKLIPHHLLDAMTSRSECSVFKYRDLAINAIHKIIRRGKIPMVVGGSGLYVGALTDGLSPLPGRKASYRKQLEQFETSVLYERLKRMNCRRAATIYPNDRKRIIRALEIMEVGKGRAEGRSGSLTDYGFKPILIGISRDRKELYERIEKRVDEMFEAGWIDEVKRLKKIGLSKTARYAIGYQEILEYLDGKKSFEEMSLEIKKRTRHLAKKQMTWFRKEPRIHWYSMSGEKYVPVMNKILRMIQPSLRGGRRPTKQSRSEIASPLRGSQ